MTWEVVAAQDESIWTEEYLEQVLSSYVRRPLPPTIQRIGSTTVAWTEVEPGSFAIHAEGGTVDDRYLARLIVGTQLRSYGMSEAIFTMGGPELRKTASWADIMAKAQRLRQDGRVQVLRNGPQVVVGHVQGDHGDYQCEISRDDPTSQVITTWQCDCPWDQFAWQRTRKWKPLEGRVCSHVLATFWEASTLPLDEEYDPAAGATVGPTGQLGFPGMPAPSPLAPSGAPGGPPVPAPGAQLSIPGIQPGTADATTPVPAPDILPQAPAPPMPVPVSIPGGKLPDPYNPTQYPGGTFSKVAAQTFNNSDMVRINADEMGIAEGKSVEHGAGEYRNIPKNSIGEVLGQDPTTGWVDVIFPIHDTGPMEPYHIRAWIEPQNLTLMPNIKKPGPFIKRRSRLAAPFVDAGQYVYHLAPAEKRDAILADGVLHAGDPGNSGRWGDYLKDKGYPVGVYVWTELDRAMDSAMHTEGMDVWRIDRGDIRGTARDPDAEGTESFVITNDVPAELHMTMEDRMEERGLTYD